MTREGGGMDDTVVDAEDTVFITEGWFEDTDEDTEDTIKDTDDEDIEDTVEDTEDATVGVADKLLVGDAVDAT